MQCGFGSDLSQEVLERSASQHINVPWLEITSRRCALRALENGAYHFTGYGLVRECTTTHAGINGIRDIHGGATLARCPDGMQTRGGRLPMRVVCRSRVRSSRSGFFWSVRRNYAACASASFVVRKRGV